MPRPLGWRTGASWVPGFLPMRLSPSLVSGHERPPGSTGVDGVWSRLRVGIRLPCRSHSCRGSKSYFLKVRSVVSPSVSTIQWPLRPLAVTGEFALEIGQCYHPCYTSLKFSFLFLTWELVSFEGGEWVGKLKGKLSSECDEGCKVFIFHFLQSWKVNWLSLKPYKAFTHWGVILCHGLGYFHTLKEKWDTGLRVGHISYYRLCPMEKFRFSWAIWFFSMKVTPVCLFFPSLSLERNTVVLCI